MLTLGIFLCLIYPAYGQGNLLKVPELQTKNNLTVDSNNLTQFTTYRDDDFGFEILYPSDWEVNTKALDYAVVIFTPIEGDMQVLVKVLPREKHESLKQFGDRTFKNNDDFTISEYYRNSNTTFAGLPAIKMIGTYHFNPNIFQQLRGEESFVKKTLYDISLVEKKDAFFGIAYFADDQPTFKEFLPTVQKMIDSVKITNLKPQIIEED